LLTLLNEREFDNGSGRVRTPLVCVIGASNEVPADEALQAFYDRFLVRLPVAPVGDASFAALLNLGDAPAAAVAALSETERGAVSAAAEHVTLSDEAVAACTALRAWLAQRNQALSDRRWRQWVGLMRTAAATEARGSVDALDLWLAPYVASATPSDVPALAQWFEAELLGAVPHDAPWLTRAVQAFEKQLEIECSAQDDPDAANAAGKLALARAIGLGAGVDADQGGMVRMVSSTLEAQLRRRYSSVHIAVRVAQVDEVIAQARSAIDAVAVRDAELGASLRARLWLPPQLAQRLRAAHAHSLGVLQSLLARLQQTRRGFAELPVDTQLPDEAPQLVPLQVEAATL
jgi:MoxR-like ATPase